MVCVMNSCNSLFHSLCCRVSRTCHQMTQALWTVSKRLFHLFLMLINDLITLRSRADMLGLDSQTWEFVKTITNGSKIVAMMRNILHLAASFSPLIVLVPKKIAVDSIRRDHLLAVRLTFLMLLHRLMISVSMPLHLEISDPQF
jgi:hypothetical protein